MQHGITHLSTQPHVVYANSSVTYHNLTGASCNSFTQPARARAFSTDHHSNLSLIRLMHADHTNDAKSLGTFTLCTVYLHVAISIIGSVLHSVLYSKLQESAVSKSHIP